MPIAPQNKQEDLVGLSRKPIVNQLHAVKDSLVKKAPDYDMHGLVDQNKLAWFFKNLGHLGNTHYPYQSYAKPEVNNGIFRMAEGAGQPVRIALLADWASSTAESIQIAQLAGVQDYSIHLGDTYYVGNSKEIADNFNDTFGAPWPYGTYGSFALLGNHEMYSSGKSYFTQLLPYMGSFAPGKDPQRQEASFFCLENDHWRIIGLDMGYDSLTGLLGLDANIKLKLPPKHVDWLTNVVQPSKDKRGIIFLSHQQVFSAFEKDEFQAIIPQIAPLLGARDVLWFWGHEHRLSLYGYNVLGVGPSGVTVTSGAGVNPGAGAAPGGVAAPSGFGCFARCIGHGGMPVELSEFALKDAQATGKNNRNLVMYDQRLRQKIDEDIALGHNGYVILELQGPDLVVRYFDDSFVDAKGARSPIAEERWSVDTATGALTGKGIVDFTEQQAKPEDRLTHLQADLNLATEKVPKL